MLQFKRPLIFISKMKNFILIVLFFLTINLYGQNPDKISKDVRDVEHISIPKSKFMVEKLYELRKKSRCLNRFSPFEKKDTIFIFEKFGGGDGFNLSNLFISCWNKKKKISILTKDLNKTYNISNDIYINPYLVKLISSWDLIEIKKEEKNNRLIDGGYCIATRIIIQDEKYTIDSISFNEFFNIET